MTLLIFSNLKLRKYKSETNEDQPDLHCVMYIKKHCFANFLQRRINIMCNRQEEDWIGDYFLCYGYDDAPVGY